MRYVGDNLDPDNPDWFKPVAPDPCRDCIALAKILLSQYREGSTRPLTYLPRALDAFIAERER